MEHECMNPAQPVLMSPSWQSILPHRNERLEPWTVIYRKVPFYSYRESGRYRQRNGEYRLTCPSILLFGCKWIEFVVRIPKDVLYPSTFAANMRLIRYGATVTSSNPVLEARTCRRTGILAERNGSLSHFRNTPAVWPLDQNFKKLFQTCTINFQWSICPSLG
ncbi:hypothetical protein BC827DRAFT_1188568 [Russula dissimulans]|nr:hypothetical protein BC827DRAFT_1188568 [Russula dissimulans]